MFHINSAVSLRHNRLCSLAGSMLRWNDKAAGVPRITGLFQVSGCVRGLQLVCELHGGEFHLAPWHNLRVIANN